MRTVAFTPDGQTVISGGGEKTKLSAWDVATGSQQPVFSQDHTGTLLKAVFAPGGQILATIGGDNRLLLWDFPERRLRSELPFNFNSPAVAFSPDGRFVAAGAASHSVRIWDVASCRPLALLHGHHARVTALAFTPSGDALVSASWDRTVRLWDLKSLRDEGSLKGHRGWVTHATFSPDGRFLASSEYFSPFQTLVWDVSARRAITNLIGHAGPSSCAFSPDGRILATGSFDRTVRLWDTMNWALVGILSNDFESTSLAFEPKSGILAVGGLMATGDEKPEFRLAKRLAFWDARSRRKLDLLPEAAVGTAAVAFSEDGQLFATSHFDGSVRLWDFRGRRLLHGFTNGSEGIVLSLAFSSNDTLLAFSSDEGKVAVYDIARRRMLTRFESHVGSVWSVDFAPDNRTLALGGDEGITLWSVTALKPALTLRRHIGSVNSVAFSPDGNTLASCGADTDVRLWRAVSVSKGP